MNDDDELILRLCTRAGMIMEDVSPTAIVMRGQQGMERTNTLITVAQAIHHMNALINAALALDQRSRP